MTGTKFRVGAVVALTLAGLLLVAAPAQAADPNPPYVASSAPDNRPLYGYHEDPLGATTKAWTGLQYRTVSGVHQYRLWIKAEGDGRQIAVELSQLSFNAWGFDTYRACFNAPCKKTGKTVWYVGTWHRVYGGEQASITGRIRVAYVYSGGWTTPECISSYRIQARSLYPVGGPPC